ncbi:hypothetical protein SAMN05444398_102225 [Roseovarius pacificus]|uniref:Uncharacterized protein n=1 Tax=Roseovarius pacificus TaxID=337701 RepID=A0A1M7A929_9RHOB|nr:hypothetical protein SAMN05444398_102225 [Roseovarius pacificus]
MTGPCPDCQRLDQGRSFQSAAGLAVAEGPVRHARRHNYIGEILSSAPYPAVQNGTSIQETDNAESGTHPA